jgi:hypothetical protein
MDKHLTGNLSDASDLQRDTSKQIHELFAKVTTLQDTVGELTRRYD